MPNLIPYLYFDGNCAEAMKFYAQILGGKLDIKTHKDSLPPEHIPPGMADRIMHARLDLDGGILMASDNLIGEPKQQMSGFSVTLVYDDAAEGRQIFDALADGGRVTMPFEKTFWAEGFGMFVDRFGTPWMINSGMAAK